MPVFHFHIRERGHLVVDEEGVEVESLEVAYMEAIEGARSIMAEAILKGQLSLDQQFEIADESGRIVLVVPFSEAVEITDGDRPSAERRA